MSAHAHAPRFGTLGQAIAAAIARVALGIDVLVAAFAGTTPMPGTPGLTD